MVAIIAAFVLVWIVANQDRDDFSSTLFFVAQRTILILAIIFFFGISFFGMMFYYPKKEVVLQDIELSGKEIELHWNESYHIYADVYDKEGNKYSVFCSFLDRTEIKDRHPTKMRVIKYMPLKWYHYFYAFSFGRVYTFLE